MSFKPIRSFAASEGDYSVDDKGPEALKADLDQLMKMFDPTSVHDNGEPGGVGADNLNFRLDDEETSAGIGSAEIEGLTADNNVYAQLSAIVNILLTHTNLADPATMSHIGGTLNGTESNGQSIIDTLYQMVVDRYSKSVVDSLIAENTNVAITGLSYNADTGVLTATAKGGTVTQVFDLNIEKIPVSVGFVEVENVTYIRITNTDGTYTQSAITDFVTQYSFNDSTEVDFTVTNATGRNKSITATIKDASIKKKHLDSAVISEMESYAESAGISAASASVSAGNASTSEANALQYKTSAEGSASAASASAGSATNSATTASQKADLATEKATLAESYAHGGTGTRPGEDTDNAEYYYRQAAGIAGGDYVTHTEYNADMATIAGNIQSAIDLAGGADAKAEAVGTYTVNGKQLKSNPVLNAGDVGAVPTTRKINGKVLSDDITLSPSDIGVDSIGESFIVDIIDEVIMDEDDGFVHSCSSNKTLREIIQAINNGYEVIARLKFAFDMTASFFGTLDCYSYDDAFNFSLIGFKFNLFIAPFTYSNNIVPHVIIMYERFGETYIVSEEYYHATKNVSIQETILLSASAWAGNNFQTVQIEGVTASNTIMVAPETEHDSLNWANSGVFCSAQSDGELTFTCTHIPNFDISVSVVILI